MGLRVRRFDYWNENLILRITWDEGTSIGKEEDRPFLSGLFFFEMALYHNYCLPVTSILMTYFHIKDRAYSI